MASDICEGDITEPTDDDEMWDDSGMPVLDLILDETPEVQSEEHGDVEDMPDLIPSLHDCFVSLQKATTEDCSEGTSYQCVNDVIGYDPYLFPFKEDQNQIEGTSTDKQSTEDNDKSTKFAMLETLQQGNKEETPAMTPHDNKQMIRHVQIIVSKLPCFMCNLCRVWFSRKQDLENHDQEHHQLKGVQEDEHQHSSSGKWHEKGFDRNNNGVSVQGGGGKLHLRSGRSKTRSRQNAKRKLVLSEAVHKGVVVNAASIGDDEVAGESHQLDYMETRANVTSIRASVLKSRSSQSSSGVSKDVFSSHRKSKLQDNVKGLKRGLDSVKSKHEIREIVKSQNKIKTQDELKSNHSKVKVQDKVKNHKKSKITQIQGQEKVKGQIDKQVVKTIDGANKSKDVSGKRKKLKGVDVARNAESRSNMKHGPSPKKQTHTSFHTKAAKLDSKDSNKISSNEIMENSEKKLECKTCSQANCTCTGNNSTSNTPQSRVKSLKCTRCPMQFSRKSSLISHLKYHDGYGSTKEYRCESCEEEFLTDSELTTHQSEHIDKLPYKCEYCEKTFVQQKSFKSHMSKIHIGAKADDKSFVCALCGAKFYTSNQLGKHRKIHIKDLPYLCQHCPQQFSELKDLKKHMMGPKHEGVKEEDWGLEQCYVHKHLTKLKHKRDIPDAE